MTNLFPAPKRIISGIASAAVLSLSLWTPPTIAGDVFRTTNTHKIGDNTEAAFKAIFKDGNYRQAKSYLQQAESTDSNEPLAYAMLASFAYTNSDWNALNAYATKTL